MIAKEVLCVLLFTVVSQGAVYRNPYTQFDHVRDYDDEMIQELVDAGVLNGPAEDDQNYEKHNMDLFDPATKVVHNIEDNNTDNDNDLQSRFKRSISDHPSLRRGRNDDELIDGCPPFFVQCMSKCYFISNFVYRYEEARKACKESGADLVAIETVQEDLFLIKKLREYRAAYEEETESRRVSNQNAMRASLRRQFTLSEAMTILKSNGEVAPDFVEEFQSIQEQAIDDLPNGWWTSGHTLHDDLSRSQEETQTWVWQSTNKTIGYSRWYSAGHPKYNVPCVLLWRRFTNFEWSSTPCNTYLGIICERDISY